MQEIFDACRHLLIILWISAFFPCIYVYGSNLVAEHADIEIQAFRLQQYEFAGKQYGCRSWRVLYEAVSMNSSLARKCVLVNWRELIDKELSTSIGAAVGAILVIIPSDLDALTEANRQAFLRMEKKFANFHTEQAVYFAPNSETLERLVQSVSVSTKKAPSAFQELYNTIAADNFQIQSSNTATTNIVTSKHYNIVGYLNAVERGKPYLFIVAHYDSDAVVPALAKGVDSNGSGVAALLEILAILSKFYGDSSNRSKFNVVFVLSAAGKFNYQGSRQWIEDFQEKHSDESVMLSLCLDSLGRDNSLNIHVAKAIANGSISHKMFENLKNFARTRTNMNVISQRINMGLERRAWEHEVYNIRHIHSMTLSHFKSPNDPLRNSLLDTRASLDLSALERNVNIITNAIISFIYDLDPKLCDGPNFENIDCSLLNDENRVQIERLNGWIDAFGMEMRYVGAIPQTKLVANLREVMQSYADKTIIFEVPIVDYVLYNVYEDKLIADTVKPAIFELFLALIIGAYLFMVYKFSLNAQSILQNGIIRLKKLV